MAITIGAAATDRASWTGSRTAVNKAATASGTGTIDTAEVWAQTDMTGPNEVATFLVVSGNNLSTRDFESIGSASSGSKQTFTGLSVDVEVGDYWGIYFGAGQIELDTTGGSGIWYTGPGVDAIPCTNQAFSTLANFVLSLYGTGTETGGGEVGASVNIVQQMMARMRN